MSSAEYRSCSDARRSSVESWVVHVVKEALLLMLAISHYRRCCTNHSYHSREPGVKVGVSPTLRLPDFFAFFSWYFLANAVSFEL